MTDYKALREAAEKAKNGKRDERCSIVPVPPTTILSLLDALAASEAKVMKAREALKAAESWFSNWGTHVPACEGHGKCTCGFDAVRYDAWEAIKADWT